VAGTQERLLLRLLKRNAGTEYGRRYGLSGIRSVAEFQARVPLSSYEDYREAIERIGQGQRGVLTRDPVQLLEPTGGSTAATKHIPYTASLKAEFQRAIAPWIVDLTSQHPRLLLGQAYWSVSPVARRNADTPGRLPVGFEEDSEYFGALQRSLIRSVMAVPALVRLIDHMDAFRYVTLLFLLRSRSLALISVWNPTFLTLLVERLPAWWSRLAADVAAGTISSPAPLAAGLQERLGAMNRPDPRRAADIQAVFESQSDPAAIHARLWPHLQLISCWADAHAAAYAPDLGRLFPQARLQGKGLLATEGVVSFPLAAGDSGGPPGAAGPVLAIRSHFFEFLPPPSLLAAAPPPGWPAPCAPHTRPLLAHELAPGGCYSVVVTTGGGLYRYRLHDLVQVTGSLDGVPRIRFLGKEAHLSDRFGEKVDERHVRQALDRLLARYAVRPAFAMVACDEVAGHDARHAYTLYVEADGQPDEVLCLLGSGLEAALQENYHYRYCRDLGQLAALCVYRIDGGALETYAAACRAHGQRVGDVKPAALHHLGGWSRVFSGRLVSPL
jgi:hypothetical protein